MTNFVLLVLWLFVLFFQQWNAIALPINNAETVSAKALLEYVNSFISILIGFLTLFSLIGGFILNYVVGAKITSKLKDPEKRIAKLERRLGKLAAKCNVEMDTFAFDNDEEY